MVHLSDVTNSNNNCHLFLITEVTSLFAYLIEGYLPSSLCAICLNSLGFIPSLVINPWDSCVTAFLGLLLSNNITFRLARPKIKQRLNPQDLHR